MLEVTDLHVSYGHHSVIRGVSFTVKKGEFVTIVGANGAGKTTLMLTMAGLVRYGRGSILFKGDNIGKLTSYEIVRKGISLIPSGRELFANMIVSENLELGGYTRSHSKIRESMDRVFQYFPQLQNRGKQMAGTLSGGEQQMLAIGRALMGSPELFLIDEPSMGLGPKIIEDIFEIFLRLHRDGTTILLVEQNATLALETAERGYVLENGRMTISGTSSDLLKSDIVRQSYLGL
jgi:branched-chain amino acid transport system ATP-binding protein